MDTCGVLSQHVFKCEVCLYTSQDSFRKEYSTPQLVAAVEREVRDEYLWQLRLQCSNDKLREPAGVSFLRFMSIMQNLYIVLNLAK